LKQGALQTAHHPKGPHVKTQSNGVVLFVATLLLAATIQTLAIAQDTVVPRSNEQLVRDQLIILVDGSGSVGPGGKFNREKDLVQAFVRAMPQGDYLAGINSFGGTSKAEWLDVPLAQFESIRMVDGASGLEAVGSMTPLATAIRAQQAEFSGIRGRGALLVFSDGEVRNEEDVLEECRNLQALHGGEVCIYTVQVGDSARGRSLLEEMANVNGCGKYYNGESLESAGAMDGVVRDIFFEARSAPSVAPRPAPARKTLPLENIYFATDSSVIDARYNTEIAELAEFLKSNPGVRVQMAGHTDSSASDQYNDALSERRVEAVKAALMQRGVNASQLVTGAYGEEKPSVPNTSAENMQLNRRVELTVVN